MDGEGDGLTLAAHIDGFDVRLRVAIEPVLALTMTVRNTTKSPATFEQALHSYFRVGDIRQVHITGLEQVGFHDKVQGTAQPAAGDAIRFAGETDRVYTGTEDPCVLHDPVLKRRIVVEKRGSRSTVVWNPWTDKAKRMIDFGDDEWPRMCCIETANVAADAVTLPPGASHDMAAMISLTEHQP